MATHAAKQAAAGSKRSAAFISDPILASKITAPDTPDWAVQRPRISKLIAEGTRWCPLTVVTGPLGAGKTMALAMKFRDDYARAGVPMLPVVAPASVVARKILFYSYVMVATTLALGPYAGWIYTIIAAGLGAWFLAGAHRLYGQVARAGEPAPAAVSAAGEPATAGGKTVEERTCAGIARPSTHPAPMRLFHQSIAYLTLLFAAIAVVSLLPWGRW